MQTEQKFTEYLPYAFQFTVIHTVKGFGLP